MCCTTCATQRVTTVIIPGKLVQALMLAAKDRDDSQSTFSRETDHVY